MEAPIYDKCLCNDCASIRWLPRIEFDGVNDPGMSACDCGGQVCWCPGCVADMEALEEGQRGMFGGFTVEITDWNPVTGIRA